jgi:Ser/Thr protein kinase RdoA (MazF antagonist)
MNAAAHPYANLTPDCVLDALQSIGLVGDGRLQALGSYENRVYQIGIEDAPPVVAKFYRPARWSDAAILEEHAFVAELAAREIPVVARCCPRGTLHTFAASACGLPALGRRCAPSLRPLDARMDGPLPRRIHVVGSLEPFRRGRDQRRDFRRRSRDWPSCTNLPRGLRTRGSTPRVLIRRGALDRAGTFTSLRLHGDCHSGNVRG